MRPLGDVRLALQEAWQQGPAQVSVAAERACVGRAVARYTASRMVDSGQLVVVQPGKPAVLALATVVHAAAAPRAASSLNQALDLLASVRWGDM
jgi:hypothetical protein